MLTRAATVKTSITLWALLIWAYKRQGVHYETDRAFSFQPAGAYAGDFLGKRRGYADSGLADWVGDDEDGGGCINGAGTIAHRDAHILHAIVRGLKRSKRQLIVDTASAGRPPVWDPVIPPLRVVPMWKGPEGRVECSEGQVRVMGKLLSLYPGQCYPGDPQRDRHVGVGHWFRYEGCDDAEAQVIRAEARESHSRWWAVLFELYREVWFEGAFERWKISSIGVAREPWKTPA